MLRGFSYFSSLSLCLSLNLNSSSREARPGMHDAIFDLHMHDELKYQTNKESNQSRLSFYTGR